MRPPQAPPMELDPAEERLRRIAYDAARRAVRDELDERGLLQGGPEPLLDVKAVARYLGVSARTVETLIAASDLVPIRIGSARRFTREAVDAFLRSRAGQKYRRRRRPPQQGGSPQS